MTDSRLHRAAVWSALALLAGCLALAGYWLLFTSFMIYDDEGYVLLSLRNFSTHGALYDQVYTQYGPFPYLLYDALHRLLGFAFTNTSGRWITLVNWLGTAGACAALAGRFTRSVLYGALTLVGTFVYLWIMINEPIHPGSLITLVVAFTAWLGAEAWGARRLGWFLAICGAASAVLILTKINVGLFLFAAVCCWLALNSARPGVARALTWTAALGCAVLPFVLMNSLIGATWVRLFALVFTAGALSALLAGGRCAAPLVGLRHWLAFLAWTAAAVLVVCALTVIRGTSVRGLVDGVVLEPLKHPGVYSFAMRWANGTGVAALASLALAVGTAWAGAWQSGRFRALVAGIRLIVAGLVLCSVLQFIPTAFANWGLSYGVSLAWVFAVPLRDRSPQGEIRTWLALVLVFQSLHAYPVPGSQLNWGTFLWVPLLALGLHDALPLVRERLGRFATGAARVGLAAMTVVTVYMAAQLARIGWDRYTGSLRLGLAGAENIRVPNDFTYTLRIADENLRAHADMLFSYPGVYSTNLWTGLPTPTLANATHWFSLLSPAQQEDIIARLAGDPRAVLLVQSELVRFLAEHAIHAHGPLITWLTENFEKSLSFGDYQIWVHRGRTIAGISLVRAGFGPDGTLTSLTATLRATSAPVARVDLCNVDFPSAPLASVPTDTATADLAPCGLDGRLTGPVTPVSFPVAVTGLSQLRLRFPAMKVDCAPRRLLVVLRAASGAVVGELLISD